MKPPDSAFENKLDELADSLDAGWDVLEAPARPSSMPHSAPLPVALDALDADWEVAAAPAAKTPALAKSSAGASAPVVPAPAATAARFAQPRPSPVRPSQARPEPTRAIRPPLAPGATPLRVSKKDRREAERKRRAHETRQKSARKKQRKAERRAEALRASEESRIAEERALAERQAREQKDPTPKRKQSKPANAEGESASNSKRIPKRVRHEHTRSARSATMRSEPRAEAWKKSKPAPVVAERGAKKLILPLLIALLVAVTLGFALSRAH